MEALSAAVSNSGGNLRRFGRSITARLSSWATAILAPTPAATVLLVRARSRRGAGMLEYALVALISLAVFGVIASQFSDIIGNLIQNIGDRIRGL